MINKSNTFWGYCWKCGKFGHSAKEYQNNTATASQDQTMVTTFKNTQNGPTNLQTIEPIRYPTTISPARPPILTQQITTDFQLSQEAWNELSSQMDEMAKTKKLLKKAVKSTYKKLTSVPKQYPKKTPNNMKASKKTKKIVKFIEKPTIENKCVNRIPKRKNDSNKS